MEKTLDDTMQPICTQLRIAIVYNLCGLHNYYLRDGRSGWQWAKVNGRYFVDSGHSHKV